MSCCGGDTIEEVMASLGSGQLKWQEVAPCITDALGRILRIWENTPYVPGQRVRKLGVDCVQAVPGVFDMLFKFKEPTILPRLPADSGAHSEKPGQLVARFLMRAYDAAPVEDSTVEPGDVVVVRNELAGTQEWQGHALIVGTRPMVAWHAQWGAGFVPASLVAVGDILKIYRSRRKQEWCV